MAAEDNAEKKSM